MGKGVNIDRVGALLNKVLHVNILLRLDESYELVTILTDDHGPEMASSVVPGHPVVVLVVEDRQTGLVVKLLETLDGDADVVSRVDGTLLLALPVVGLRGSQFSAVAPESIRMGCISGRNPHIFSSSPEPSVHVNWL